MGYVGNQQSEGFSSIPAKQDLTGATGTSLTLSHAVASAEGIDLFINNVRQEPTTAYSVGGDGVTVTLTGSVVATDDIYVVYNSLALQTTVPPDGSVTSAKLDTNISVAGDLTVDTTTLKVDSSSGNVGIGTSSPNAKLTSASLSNTSAISVINANATTTGLETNYLSFFGTSNGGSVFSTPLAQIGAVSQNGSLTQGSMVFHTTPFGGSSTEAMRIDNNGALLVNTTARNGTANFVVSADAVTANPISVVNTKTTASTDYAILFYRVSSIVGSIQTSLSATSYLTSSDYRLKTAVEYDWDATSRLKQLKPARFKWIVEGDDAVFVDGFLAHEVQDIVPEAISGTKDAVDEDGNPEYQSIDQSKLVPLLVRTIIELEARITALEAS